MIYIFTYPRGENFKSETSSQINSLSLPSSKLFYLSLFIIWHRAILNGGYVCFPQSLVLLQNAYYVKRLCFFTPLYYGRLSSLSILRAVWYKIKDSELRGNCSISHVFSSLVYRGLQLCQLQRHFKYIFS